MNNYEKAKEEGIKDFGRLYLTDTDSPLVVSGVIDLEAFLSSFAEKIKEGVDRDWHEKYSSFTDKVSADATLREKDLEKLRSSDSQTIKENEQ